MVQQFLQKVGLKVPSVTTTVQHVTRYSTHVDVTLLRDRGVIFLKAWRRGRDGSVDVTRKVVIDLSIETWMDSIHDGDGWYMPTIKDALSMMDAEVMKIKLIKEPPFDEEDTAEVIINTELPPFLEG